MNHIRFLQTSQFDVGTMYYIVLFAFTIVMIGCLLPIGFLWMAQDYTSRVYKRMKRSVQGLTYFPRRAPKRKPNEILACKDPDRTD